MGNPWYLFLHPKMKAQIDKMYEDAGVTQVDWSDSTAGPTFVVIDEFRFIESPPEDVKPELLGTRKQRRGKGKSGTRADRWR